VFNNPKIHSLEKEKPVPDLVSLNRSHSEGDGEDEIPTTTQGQGLDLNI